MIGRLAHVGIVVRSIEAALPFYTQVLGLGPAHIHELPAQGVRLAFLAAGGVEIELLEPLAPDSGIARFLEKRGEGLHHVCFTAADLEGELDRLAGMGVELLNRTPQQGVGKEQIAFLHPRAAHGVLIELEERVDRTE